MVETCFCSSSLLVVAAKSFEKVVMVTPSLACWVSALFLRLIKPTPSPRQITIKTIIPTRYFIVQARWRAEESLASVDYGSDGVVDAGSVGWRDARACVNGEGS